jgi:Carbohydrate binding module (family 6)
VWLHCGGYFQYKATQAPIRIEAEKYNSTGGYWTVAPEETIPGVLRTQTYMYRFDPKDWVKYSNINLSGKSKISFNIASRVNGGGIEVRTGSPTGNVLGKLVTANADASLLKYSTQTIPITTVNGVFDIYLVGVDTYEVGRIDWIELK